MHRPLFVTGDDIYLLNHSVGLLLRSTQDHVQQQFFGPWQDDPEGAWPAWLAAIDRFRAELASLLDTRSALLCPQPNVSSAVTKILYGMPSLGDRSTVLLSEEAFPSLGYVFQQANNSGIRVKYIPRQADTQDPGVWRDHMTADVGLALITHVHSNTGQLMPVRQLCEVAIEREVTTIIDVAQSVGVRPVTPEQWQADFVVGSCVKWLCGGPGAGFVWVKESLLPIANPVDVGWFSHQDPFEFDIHRFRYADDALRFWGGTPSILPYVVATNAISTLRRIGVEHITEHNLALTQRLIDRLDDDQLASPRDPVSRSATTVVRLDRCRPGAVDRLREAKVKHDLRSSGIRLSPHIYNTTEEIDTTLACLTDAS